MTELALARLGQIETEIREHDGGARESGQQFILHAWEIGRRLLEAKELFPSHVAFGRWANEKFGYTQQHRHSLMRLGQQPTSALVGLFSLRGGLRAFAPPEESPAVVLSSPLPAGHFSTIEADPPWALDAAEGKSAHRQYATMTVEEIEALGDQVLERAADDCHLYLWAINPMLPEAFQVMTAWRFEYKTLLTWVKPQIGTGHYYRGATEQCLFGVRGDLSCLRADQPNWFQANRGRHSQKPARFYEIAESMSPGPRLRMFARDEREGWANWINE